MTSTAHKKFETFLQTALNTQQVKAVVQEKGSLLVVAGAGSGKTRVITARILHLILQAQVPPSAIVALTFTNKAAREMKKRIEQFLGAQHEAPFIGTFHSYCLNLLKKNPHLLEAPFFSIIDQDDRKKMLDGIIKRNNLQKRITGKRLGYQISQLKNQTLSKEEQQELFSMTPLLADLYQAYEQEKKASKCFDFDDLLLQGLELFTKNKDFKKQYHENVRHVLVDEYQDTNIVQHELLKNMTQKGRKTLAIDSLCAVGDEDQSIYSWRGATVANIMNFTTDFPKTTIVKIEQNYRSVQQILDVANNVINCNENRNPKNLWSEKKGNDRIHTFTFLSEYQEAECIAQFAKTTDRKKSIAILYRTHAQSRPIEEALVRHTIPYKIIGGLQFYERKEIKDILAYLRLIVNPFDRPSFFRIINMPARGLGQKFEELFYQRWSAEPFLNFKQITEKLTQEELVKGTKQQALEEFVQSFVGRSATEKASVAVEQFLSHNNYLGYLKDTYDPEDAQGRIDNIKELLDAIKYAESQNSNTIQEFLHEVALMQEKITDAEEQKNPILMMTLHAAKGLEFDTVILAGLEEGTLPTNRALLDSDAIEEERRLFYVGITRAEERLLLMHTKFRYTYGQMTEQMMSRFLKEIPKNLTQQHDASYWNDVNMRTHFAYWLGIQSPISQPTDVSFGPSHKITKSSATSTNRGSIPRQSPIGVDGQKSSWRRKQPVSHQKFGIGIVEKIDKKSDGSVYLTVKFKRAGVKKIMGKFLTKI